MRFLYEIPLELVKMPLDQFPVHFPQYSFVVSYGTLKVYKQIR